MYLATDAVIVLDDSVVSAPEWACGQFWQLTHDWRKCAECCEGYERWAESLKFTSMDFEDANRDEFTSILTDAIPF